MTNQAVKGILVTDNGTHGFLATVTDQVTYTELLDSVNGLSLWKVAKGKTCIKAAFAYVAGQGMMRVRNTQTNQVKAYVLGTMIKGIGAGMDAWEKFEAPFTIEDGDILEAFCNVASS